YNDPAGDAAGSHRDHFVIRGHSPQADQDAHEHAEGDAQQQHGRQHQNAQFEKCQTLRRAHQHFEQPAAALQEYDKSCERGGENRAREDFPENVPAENLHFALAARSMERAADGVLAASVEGVAVSGEGTTGSLGSSSSIFVNSRSSISREGATTDTSAVLE